MAMALGFTEFAKGQDIVKLTGFPSLKNAVARQYTPSQSIYYCEDSEMHYFVLYDLANLTNVIVAEFPSFLDLKEFEVFDDTVFFCGTFPQSGNPYGFVGQISVQDLFYNNGQYNFGTYLHLVVAPCPYAPFLASCDRMDVFRSGDHVHFAVVGELEESATYGTALRRTASDIWFNGSVWVGQSLFQKENYYKTSDITCTENLVVVSAYDDEKDYSVLLAFNKIPNFTSSPIANMSYRINDRRFDDNILVERLLFDDVAVTHYFENSTDGSYGTAVHHINNVASLPTPLSHFSLHYTHGFNTPISVLRDIRFNALDEEIGPLLLLHDIDEPLWNSPVSTIYDFDVYTLPSLTAQAWHANDDVSLFSVDNRVQYPLFSLVGNHNSSYEPLLTLKISGANNCYNAVPIKYKDVPVKFSTGPLDDYTLDIRPQSNTPYYPNPQVYDVENNCGN